LLTKEELVVIAIGLDFLRESLGQEREDLIAALDSLQKKVKSLTGDITHATPTVDSAHRAIILRAVKERKDLEIEYHSLIRDEVSTRRVTPIELGEDKGIEVLLAYCSKALGFRTFRLDNMKKVALLEVSATVSSAPEISSSLFSAKCRVNSRLRTTYERFRIETSPLNPLSKDRVVEVTSFSQDWLIRNFMSTLANAEIVGPIDLAKRVGQKARATLDLYSNEKFA
jgi:proteasome accessory factor C